MASNRKSVCSKKNPIASVIVPPPEWQHLNAIASWSHYAFRVPLDRILYQTLNSQWHRIKSALQESNCRMSPIELKVEHVTFNIYFLFAPQTINTRPHQLNRGSSYRTLGHFSFHDHFQCQRVSYGHMNCLRMDKADEMPIANNNCLWSVNRDNGDNGGRCRALMQSACFERYQIAKNCIDQCNMLVVCSEQVVTSEGDNWPGSHNSH